MTYRPLRHRRAEGTLSSRRYSEFYVQVDDTINPAIFFSDVMLSILAFTMQVNGTLFLDKREASQLDFLTVNETAVDPPTPGDDPDNNINAPDRLSLEATMINQNFSQQILKPGNRKVVNAYCYIVAVLPCRMVCCALFGCVPISFRWSLCFSFFGLYVLLKFNGW